MMSRFRTFPSAVLLFVACGRGPALPFDEGTLVIEDPCESGQRGCVSEATLQRAADILFVIDNSGSMGTEQSSLARNFSAFINVLEREGLGLNYRIGVVNTSLGPMTATSCLDHLSDFVWDRGTPEQYTDARREGCLDVCRVEDFEVRPSRNVNDTALRQRPWIESSPDGNNLPRGVSMIEAFECMGPQGIDGEGLESPLESMYQVLNEDDSGFIREDALLAVIFLTDETDCSMPPEHLQLLKNGDSSTLGLWVHPKKMTSAVCWKAGVRCEGGPGIYASCEAENLDFSANPTSPENAVLYPVDRYITALRELSNRKQRRGGNGTALVAVIGGVPEGYPDGAPLVYQDSDSIDFNFEYGIGPGCGRGTETLFDPPGMPPVRLREFAEAFATDRRNLYSICSNDYSAALEDIAAAVGRLGSRSCVPGCVRDEDSAIAGLQVACNVYQEDLSGERVPVEPCAVTQNGWFFPDEDAETCYRALTDRTQLTPFEHDDLSPQCLTRGSNVEIVLERRPDAPPQSDAVIRVDCPTTSQDTSNGCT